MLVVEFVCRTHPATFSGRNHAGKKEEEGDEEEDKANNKEKEVTLAGNGSLLAEAEGQPARAALLFCVPVVKRFNGSTVNAILQLRSMRVDLSFDVGLPLVELVELALQGSSFLEIRHGREVFARRVGIQRTQLPLKVFYLTFERPEIGLEAMFFAVRKVRGDLLGSMHFDGCPKLVGIEPRRLQLNEMRSYGGYRNGLRRSAKDLAIHADGGIGRIT
jgi:hypothetical protein